MYETDRSLWVQEPPSTSNSEAKSQFQTVTLNQMIRTHLLAVVSTLLCVAIASAQTTDEDTMQLTLFPNEAVVAEMIPLEELDEEDLKDIADEFRAIAAYGKQNPKPGFSACIPSFIKGPDESDPNAIVYGVFRINDAWLGGRADIPVSELGDVSTHEKRFAAVHRWGVLNGFATAIPDYNDNSTPGRATIGAIKIKKNVQQAPVVLMEVPASRLKGGIFENAKKIEPRNLPQRFFKASVWLAFAQESNGDGRRGDGRLMEKFAMAIPTFYDHAAGSLLGDSVNDLEERMKPFLADSPAQLADLEAILSMPRFWGSSGHPKEKVDRFVNRYLELLRSPDQRVNPDSLWITSKADLQLSDWYNADIQERLKEDEEFAEMADDFEGLIRPLFSARNEFYGKFADLELDFEHLKTRVYLDTGKIARLMKAPQEQSQTVDVVSSGGSSGSAAVFKTTLSIGNSLLSDLGVPKPGLSTATGLISLALDASESAPRLSVTIDNPGFQNSVIDEVSGKLIDTYSAELDALIQSVAAAQKAAIQTPDGIHVIMDAWESGKLQEEWITTEMLADFQKTFRKLSWGQLMRFGLIGVFNHKKDFFLHPQPSAEYRRKYSITGDGKFSITNSRGEGTGINGYVLYCGEEPNRRTLTRNLSADQQQLLSELFDFMPPRQIYEHLLVNDRLFEILPNVNPGDRSKHFARSMTSGFQFSGIEKINPSPFYDPRTPNIQHGDRNPELFESKLVEVSFQLMPDPLDPKTREWTGTATGHVTAVMFGGIEVKEDTPAEVIERVRNIRTSSPKKNPDFADLLHEIKLGRIDIAVGGESDTYKILTPQILDVTRLSNDPFSIWPTLKIDAQITVSKTKSQKEFTTTEESNPLRASIQSSWASFDNETSFTFGDEGHFTFNIENDKSVPKGAPKHLVLVTIRRIE